MNTTKNQEVKIKIILDKKKREREKSLIKK